MPPNRVDNRVLPPADNFGRSGLNSARDSLAAPWKNPDYRPSNAPREADLEIDPIAVGHVHSAENQEDVSRTHLVSELGRESFRILNRVMLRNTQISPCEVRRVV